VRFLLGVFCVVGGDGENVDNVGDDDDGSTFALMESKGLGKLLAIVALPSVLDFRTVASSKVDF
jgi:hypothetical protein